MGCTRKGALREEIEQSRVQDTGEREMVNERLWVCGFELVPLVPLVSLVPLVYVSENLGARTAALHRPLHRCPIGSRQVTPTNGAPYVSATIKPVAPAKGRLPCGAIGSQRTTIGR